MYGGFDETGPVEKMFLLTKADIDDLRQYGMSKQGSYRLLFRAKQSQSKQSQSKKMQSPAKKTNTKKSQAKSKKSKSKKSPAKKKRSV